jgi:hypothetical protein
MSSGETAAVTGDLTPTEHRDAEGQFAKLSGSKLQRSGWPRTIFNLPSLVTVGRLGGARREIPNRARVPDPGVKFSGALQSGVTLVLVDGTQRRCRQQRTRRRRFGKGDPNRGAVQRQRNRMNHSAAEMSLTGDCVTATGAAAPVLARLCSEDTGTSSPGNETGGA